MNSTDWIQEKSADTLHPAQVQNTLERLAENWPADALRLRDSARGVSAGRGCAAPSALRLEHLRRAAGPASGDSSLDFQPADLFRAAQPSRDAHRPATGRRRLDLFRATLGRSGFGRDARCCGSRCAKWRRSRRWRKRPLELSQLAEICLREVYTYWDCELRSRRGGPDAQFAILGLGKLGGRELNHSSDIDVIFLYEDEGQVSSNFTYHEWFNQLGAKIIETFAAHDPGGALFRIDLRLRPEGTAGPLARSLESMENYYAGFGETWERLALIKARGIAGSRELAYEFLRQHQPFIFPKSPTPDVLEEIAGIKRRIERDIVGHENIGRDVKLGAGGIREIEFVVQALQLLHGARHAFLQETSTLKALPVLAELELLPRSEARVLENGYRFLRRVEHRLQIEAEQQTHTVPEDPEALPRLARSLGFPSSAKFNAALRERDAAGAHRFPPGHFRRRAARRGIDARRACTFSATKKRRRNRSPTWPKARVVFMSRRGPARFCAICGRSCFAGWRGRLIRMWR